MGVRCFAVVYLVAVAAPEAARLGANVADGSPPVTFPAIRAPMARLLPAAGANLGGIGAMVTRVGKWKSAVPRWLGGKRGRAITLGVGRHSTVYACKLPILGDLAVKVVNFKNAADEERFEQEREFLSSFDGEDNIVGYRGALTSTLPAQGRSGFLFQEKADGTLRDVIAKRKVHLQPVVNGFDAEAARLAIDLLRGISAVASRHCVHRDITPSNVFVFGDWRSGRARAKLGDFGRAEHVWPMAFPAFRSKPVWNVAPSDPAYAAPERPWGDGSSSPEQIRQDDVWSAGVVLTELFTGSLPEAWREATSNGGWRKQYWKNHRMLRRHLDKRVADRDVRVLLIEMLRAEPDNRFSSWMALDSLEKLAARRGFEVFERSRSLPRRAVSQMAIPQELADSLHASLPFGWA